VIAYGSALFGYVPFRAAWPNGVTGATPPAWLPIVVGIAFIAYPQLVWLHDKRPQAQVSNYTMIWTFLFGAALMFYGVKLWLRS
jgi:vacuolar-type H+-ATPase subunit I/STV1